MDPYIQVKVRGHVDDKQKQRTKTVKNNGEAVFFLLVIFVVKITFILYMGNTIKSNSFVSLHFPNWNNLV